MPLAFFNHCWRAHRFARVTDTCALQTYHATCEMVAKSKREAMNRSVASVTRHGCARAAPNVLTPQQLHAFMMRKAQPSRLTMQQRDD